MKQRRKCGVKSQKSNVKEMIENAENNVTVMLLITQLKNDLSRK